MGIGGCCLAVTGLSRGRVESSLMVRLHNSLVIMSHGFCAHVKGFVFYYYNSKGKWVEVAADKVCE